MPEAYRRDKGLVGEALLFPAPNNPTKPVDDQRAIDWLRRAERLAGFDLLPGGAYHCLRRKWATERKDMSPKDVAEVGGWTDVTTLQKVYQRPDEETMEAVCCSPSVSGSSAKSIPHALVGRAIKFHCANDCETGPAIAVSVAG